MIVMGGVILLVGIVFVHFWREIIVGVLAIVLFAHFFKDNGDLINYNTTGLDTKETIIDDTVDVSNFRKAEYLDDCIALTQKRDLCQEITAQLTDSL